MKVIEEYWVLSIVLYNAVLDINYNCYWDDEEKTWGRFDFKTKFFSELEANRKMTELILDSEENLNWSEDDIQINKFYQKKYIR